MGYITSLKIHIYIRVYFGANLGSDSDEPKERFHQDTLTKDKQYQGRTDPATTGDYCWVLMRESNTKYEKKFLFAKKVYNTVKCNMII